MYGSPPSDIGNLIIFWPTYLDSLKILFPAIFKLFGFQSFDYESNR